MANATGELTLAALHALTRVFACVARGGVGVMVSSRTHFATPIAARLWRALQATSSQKSSVCTCMYKVPTDMVVFKRAGQVFSFFPPLKLIVTCCPLPTLNFPPLAPPLAGPEYTLKGFLRCSFPFPGVFLSCSRLHQQSYLALT